MSSSVTGTSGAHPNALYEWANFDESLANFEDSMRLKLDQKTYDSYAFNRNYLILSHDDVVFQMLTICNEIFTKRILNDFPNGNHYFHACPKKANVKEDIYYIRSKNFMINNEKPFLLILEDKSCRMLLMSLKLVCKMKRMN